MAILGPFYNAYLMINTVDLSAKVKSVTLNYTAAMLDASAMGNLTKINMAGVLDWSLGVEFNEDLNLALVNETLWPLVGAAAFAVKFAANGGTPGATNYKYEGDAVLSGCPIGGSHGALATKSATFNSAGTLTRRSTGT